MEDMEDMEVMVEIVEDMVEEKANIKVIIIKVLIKRKEIALTMEILIM